MAITCTIDENGITAPQYAEVLEYFQTAFRSIYGDDVYLGNDSQDGQFLAVIASAMHDVNSACVAVYNSFSPQTAAGAGLSSNVKINGISRLVATRSTVDVTIVGQKGTTIVNGVVSDGENNWDLPASVTIPLAGQVTVVATAQEEGDITALPDTVTTISTPVFGWQSVTNDSAAIPGRPVESDAALRIRQSYSVALPSLTAFDGIIGAVKAIDGVTRVKAYENDTASVDSNGLPAHSISLVVQGGESQDIAEAILAKKTPGCYTNGTTSVNIINDYGVTNTIRYSEPTAVPILAEITIEALTGYTTSIAGEIKTAVVEYIDSLLIGDSVYISRLYVPSQLVGTTNFSKFRITSIEIAEDPGPVGSSDVSIAWNELATITAENITVTVP